MSLSNRPQIGDMRTEAIMGVIEPEIAEAKLAERWPSVAAYLGGAPARLGARMQLAARQLIRTALRLPLALSIVAMIFAVPVAMVVAMAAWLLLAPFFFLRIMPVTATRYVLTNKAIRVCKGWSGRVVAEMPLSKIAQRSEATSDFPAPDVRVVAGSEQDFYRAADLEIYSVEGSVLVLRGVKEYEQFRQMIENAWLVWGRREMPREQIHPASELDAKKS